MAYSTSNPPRLLTQSVARSTGLAGMGALWAHYSTDTSTGILDIEITNGQALGMKHGDVMYQVNTADTFALSIHPVITVASTKVTVGTAA